MGMAEADDNVTMYLLSAEQARDQANLQVCEAQETNNQAGQAPTGGRNNTTAVHRFVW